MLGQKKFKPKLFYNVQLEQLVPRDHELRQVLKVINFDTVRADIQDKYSHTGHPSIDPVVVIKMLFLGYYYGIHSERKLAKEISLNNAYRWFLGYDLDESTPTHSVLSKARSRYGVEVFQVLFDRIVEQCVKAGLVGGQKAFLDTTLIEANASRESLVPRVQVMTPGEYTDHLMKEEKAVCPDQEPQPPQNPPRNFNERMVSSTDPDATFIDRGKKAGLNYEGHYLVDGQEKVIVGVTTTDTVDNAGNYAPELLQRAFFRHRFNFESLCADAEYGIQSLYAFLHEQGMNAYIPPAESGQRQQGGLFSKSAFEYDEASDTYRCPARQMLRRNYVNHRKQQIGYRCKASICNQCSLKSQCTTSKYGRKMKRLFYEKWVHWAKQLQKTDAYRRQMRARRVVVEPLFAEAKGSHGLRRAKYRGMEKVSIQVLWTATIQNMKRLLKAATRPPRAIMAALVAPIAQCLANIRQQLMSRLNFQRACCSTMLCYAHLV